MNGSSRIFLTPSRMASASSTVISILFVLMPGWKTCMPTWPPLKAKNAIRCIRKETHRALGVPVFMRWTPGCHTVPLSPILQMKILWDGTKCLLSRSWMDKSKFPVLSNMWRILPSKKRLRRPWGPMKKNTATYLKTYRIFYTTTT